MDIKLISFFVVVIIANLLYESKASTDSNLVNLNEHNWESMLEGEWMVKFYAPWCPACKNLAPAWEQFSNDAADLGVKVAKIDVTKSPSLSGRFLVTALPTIYHVKDRQFRQYRGSRDGPALTLFIKDKKWEKIEPLSSWKKPDTVHMSVLSYFFKLSHTLKDFNTRLQEEYGLPTWGSYALFAVGTIFVGAALGLMLVCVVDFLYPPKRSQRQSFSESKDKDYNSVEDLANEELEDDALPENENEYDEGDDGEDEDYEDDEEADPAEEENESTSEGEKNSHSEADEPESLKTEAKKQDDDVKDNIKQSLQEKSSPSEVRKRKPRKAD